MNVVEVKTQNKDYKVYIDKSFNNIKNLIPDKKVSNIFIITDDNVEKLYLSELKNLLRNFKVFEYIVQNGEKSKSLDCIKNIYNFAINNNIDKSTLVVALGGGVVGDIAGFFSSTYYRGIKFIQIPTTLLSQVDSSVGGKTGIDCSGYKNVIGTIYQPEFVFINIKTLYTLEDREFSSGMSEVIKYGIGFDYNLFKYLEENSYDIKLKKESFLLHIIENSIKIKKDIVYEDELDLGIRMKLNLGHSFGHSIEKSSNFSYTHGEAIAIGSMMSLNLSIERELVNIDDLERIKSLYRKFDLPTQLKNISSEIIYMNMLKDKKNVGKKINICVIREIGSCVITNEFNKEEIILAIDSGIGEK